MHTHTYTHLLTNTTHFHTSVRDWNTQNTNKIKQKLTNINKYTRTYKIAQTQTQKIHTQTNTNKQQNKQLSYTNTRPNTQTKTTKHTQKYTNPTKTHT